MVRLQELDKTQCQESYYLSLRTVIPTSVGQGGGYLLQAAYVSEAI